MIGFVAVSHSAKLAEGVCDLAGQVAQGKVRIAAAGGTSDAANPIGTDAFKVLEAIETIYSEDGVLVFTDLGSAVLSAETAMELLAEEKRRNVRLCSAPLVEGIVAAVSQAAAGAGLAEIIQEAESALAAKTGSGQVVPDPSETGWEEKLVTLSNALGLHARPAAQLVRIARTCDAPVTIENLTGGAGPCDATSLNGILSLGARKGHQMCLRARGSKASQVLASIESFLASGCGDELSATPITPASSASAPGDQLTGIPASVGIAIGPLVKLRPRDVVVKARAAEEPAVEWRRLQDAIQGAEQETRDLYEWAMAHAGSNEAGIFDAQLLCLEDPVLKSAVSHSVLEKGLTAEQAWQEASGSLAEQLASLSDPYLRARAADVADVAMRVLRRLVNLESRLPDVREPSILAAHDVKPSEVKDLNTALVLGLCLESGSSSAHSSILARAMGIPVVVGLGPALSLIDDGTTVALDGERGIVWPAPDPARRAELEGRRQSWLAIRQAAQSRRFEPSCTRDGHRVMVFANINSVAGAAEALDCGADGVGVVRTEFLFLNRLTAPSEEQQFATYRAIAGTLGGRPLVIRTLDAGGDKSLPYLNIGEEANPFLGWRGIRLTLDRPDLLKTQFRAILRAAVGHRVEILLPMVSSLTELRQAGVLLREAEVELERESIAFQRDVKLAVMIEVPSAVAIADQLAREASHLSIGTNDLVQYAMAADRTNPRVVRIADPFQPALLRMLHQVIHAGREAGTGVTLCGEFAADTLATPVLLGLGLREFSVSAPLIPELKHAIAQWSLPEAESLAVQSLGLESADAVRKAVDGRRSR